MSLGELFTLLGYLTGGAVFYWQARSSRRATGGMATVALAGLLFGIGGAILSQALVGGIAGRSVIGGVVAGWMGVELAKRRMGIRRSTGDLFALALPAGEAVGRIGCYLNGCCYGIECAMPWRVWQHGAYRHPTQIYSALWAAAIFAFLLWTSRRPRPEGALFRYYLVLFGAGRIVIEFWRVNPTVFGNLTAAQWFGLELIAVSVAMSLTAKRAAVERRA